MKKTQQSARGVRGFTLIEVTIAIGVSAFAILSMLGVMAVGMTTMRGAIDDTVQSQISQTVMGTLRQANFTTLSNAPTWDWKFDDRGVVIAGNAPQIYGADVAVTNATLPGGTANPNLLKVRITIRNIADPTSQRVISTFIANNGQ